MRGKDLRIVYMGTPEFAVASLKALTDGGYNIVAVITAPDKPAGRGLKVQESAVKSYAVEAGIPVLQPVKLKDPDFVEQFRRLNADLAIVVAFRMLPEVIWSMPRLGTFNLHASLLPQYRGAAPINWAIINGETKTGVTTFFLNAKIDEGEIIDMREVDILPEDNAGSLHDKLMAVGSGLVVESVDRIASGDYKLISQDSLPDKELKPAPKIFRETCRIDLTRTGYEIINLIRGVSPYPGAWAEMTRDGEVSDGFSVKIFEASFYTSEGQYIGSVGDMVSDEKNFLRVCCSDGMIEIKELQPAGKRRMEVSEFLRGFGSIGEYTFK